MLRVTLRGLRAHLARLILTTLVVLMGVSFVVSVQVLTDTLRDGFADLFADAGQGIDAVVRSSEKVATPLGGEERAAVPATALDLLTGVPSARAVEGVVQRETRLVGPDGELVETPGGAPVFAANWLDDPTLNVWRIVDGHAPEGEGEVVVDLGLAEDQGLTIGTTVSIPASTRTEVLTVVGTARFGEARNLAGASAVLLETSVAQRLFVEPGQFNQISVSATAGTDQQALAAEVRTRLSLDPGLEVTTGAAFVKEGQDAFDQLFDIVNSLLASFGYIGLFVSSFIISNTFSIVVAQRSRELALLRALGAARAQVVRSVVTEALLVGILASLLGAVVGVGFGALVTGLLAGRGFVPPDAPLAIRPAGYIAPVVMGALVTVLSSLVPAWRASRIPPVAAMRQSAVEDRRPSRRRIVLSVVTEVFGGAAILLGLLADIPYRQLAVFGGMGLVFLGMAGLAPAITVPASRWLGRPFQAVRKITGRLAWENAARSPKRSGATSSAVMIGVALVVFIAILGESFRATTTDAIDRSIRADLVINPRSVNLQGISPELTARAAEVPGIAAVGSFRGGRATFDGNDAAILAVNPRAFLQVVALDIKEGDVDSLGTDGFGITEAEAAQRGWKIGQQVRAEFLGEEARTLTVRGIFSSNLLRGTNAYVIDQRLFEQVFPPIFQTDLQIYVKLDADADAAAVRQALEMLVREYPPAKVQDLSEFKAARTKPIDNFVFFLWAMLLLAVVISMIGIINTLLLAVVERTREIGLLRAGGMARTQVRQAVRYEAVILAVIGASLGLVVGIFFAWCVVLRFRDEGLEVLAIPWGQLAIILVAAGVGGVLAAVWPAHRAATLDVLDAIATE